MDLLALFLKGLIFSDCFDYNNSFIVLANARNTYPSSWQPKKGLVRVPYVKPELENTLKQHENYTCQTQGKPVPDARKTYVKRKLCGQAQKQISQYIHF